MKGGLGETGFKDGRKRRKESETLEERERTFTVRTRTETLKCETTRKMVLT